VLAGRAAPRFSNPRRVGKLSTTRTTGVLKSAVDALGALAVGEDALRIEAIVAKLNDAAGGSGPGGITPWLKIAGMAQAFNLPVVSHLYPEISVHVVAAVPNGLTVEYMPWSAQLFEEVPRPVEGMLTVPDRPGLGLVFDRSAIKRFAA
jgi:hypothetical protein